MERLRGTIAFVNSERGWCHLQAAGIKYFALGSSFCGRERWNALKSATGSGYPRMCQILGIELGIEVEFSPIDTGEKNPRAANVVKVEG